MQMTGMETGWENNRYENNIIKKRGYSQGISDFGK